MYHNIFNNINQLVTEKKTTASNARGGPILRL
jgi:hypothetical protein